MSADLISNIVGCDLPYQPTISDQVLLGLWPIAEERQRQHIERLIGSTNYWMPCIRIDPIGYAIASAPCDGNQELLKELSGTAVAERRRRMQKVEWNNFHCRLLPTAVRLLSATAAAHYFDGVNDCVCDDTALLHKLQSQCRWHLIQTPGSIKIHDTLSEDLVWEILDRHIVSQRPNFAIWQSWRSPTIHRRTAKKSKIDAWEIRLNRPRQHRFAIFRSALLSEEADLKERDNAITKSNREAKNLGARRRAQSCGRTFSGVPPHGGVTETAMARALEWSLGEEPAQRLLALQLSCCVRDDQLQDSSIIENEIGAYLSTPIHSVNPPPLSAVLHVPVVNEFVRRVPDSLAAEANHLIKSPALKKSIDQKNAFIMEHMDATISKLYHCLRCQMPSWHGAPWLLAELGFYPARVDSAGKIKAPGATHYTLWSPTAYEDQLLRYYRSIGFDSRPDPNVASLPCCGSSNCPKPNSIKQMFHLLPLLLHEANNSDNFTLIAIACNAASSILRLLEMLLTGTRNYPSQAPSVVFTKGEPLCLTPERTIYEKVRPRHIVLPPVFIRLLLKCALIYEKIRKKLEQMGYLVDTGNLVPPPGDPAYFFLPRNPVGRKVRAMSPRRSLVVDGLLHHPSTEPYAQLSPYAMRNLSYLLLTQSDGLSMFAPDYHDHVFFGSSYGTLNRHSTPSCDLRGLRLNAAHAIIEQLGIQSLFTVP